ncbi:MAG: type II toxin-antitoxin system mRNA interferase toxin, RelE/StbE family [Candidatus Omnitrophica bacterium]|nr:type II toxin-antitoxin system mRNA interferase toxin, RelE/StbE family [Candidatus Omnitrophota bacterium]
MIKGIILPKPAEKKLRNLPKNIRKKFWDLLERLIDDPNYPALRNKKIKGTRGDWEFSITMNYRATYKIERENLVIINIGKHEDVF